MVIRVSLPVAPVAARSCPHDGDVNGDGAITPADALMTFEHFLETTELEACQQGRAEVDEDASITPADALCIFKEYLGLLPNCLKTCRKLFFAQDIVEADNSYKAELVKNPANQEAHLFRFATRLLRIAEENQDGPDPAAVTDSFQGMLDGFGLTSEGRSIFDFFARPPEDPVTGRLDLPNTSPTGADIQTFLHNVVLPEIIGAIEENLAAIDTTFSLMLSTEDLHDFGFPDEGLVEIDFGDVKIFEAGLRASRAALLSTVLAYTPES